MRKNIIAAFIVLMPAVAVDAAVETLPYEATAGTTFTATVSEQVNVSLPEAITFDVVNVSADTASSEQTVSLTNIVLGNGKVVLISISADAANFTPPAGGSVTWACSDVSFNQATWVNSIEGYNGFLNTGGFWNMLAVSDYNAPSLSTNDLVFSLKGKNTVDRAGNHTLSATWKIETSF